jgi:hypothetical protein
MLSITVVQCVVQGADVALNLSIVIAPTCGCVGRFEIIIARMSFEVADDGLGLAIDEFELNGDGSVTLWQELVQIQDTA